MKKKVVSVVLGILSLTISAHAQMYETSPFNVDVIPEATSF